MEWFSTLIQSIKDINWAISLIASIPLAITANLLTPRVSNWLAKRSVEKTKSRIDRLQEELQKVYDLNQDKDKLSYANIIALLKVLAFIALGGAMDFLGAFGLPLGAVFYLSSFMTAQKHIVLLRRCQNFREFENKTTTEIEELSEKTSNQPASL